MKKSIYAIAIIFLLGIISTSCAVDKKCPAYTKSDTNSISKNA